MSNNFVERLNYVLNDRKQTPWGTSLGLASGSISSIFGGRIPGAEILNVIRRAENVNLNWLITGEGQPFIVDNIQESFHLSETVDTMLEDEDWQVCVCSLTEQAVLVLVQSSAYEFKGKWVNYSICEVLIGKGSEGLANVLRKHHAQRDIYTTPNIPKNVFRKLINAELGTYALLHHDLTKLEQWMQPASQEVLQYVPENNQSAPIAIPLMRKVVKSVEQHQEKTKQLLNSDQKARVITAVYRQAEKTEMSDDEFQAVIETSFDVLKD